ncbi:formimidoylglutamase [Niabella pedocola]|uniref:Formimidoylglutamase n=1 Tax=Niabella pedocola TaxID=1752077 RepID=A0ABS8PNT7_9BACT|nr:formimidoylglutamase [Niabella pedocola]MCD2422767.1 formimidoylglutamase [Niabella pedocola]
MIVRYQSPSAENWQGRVDGTIPACRRWHQVMQLLDLNDAGTDLGASFVLLGFACDEGVRRNQGRPGAVQGPAAIRSVLKNLPVHHAPAVMLYDAGDITCEDGNLEAAQEALATAVHIILKRNAFPLILGGGHEVTYGHFKGSRKAGNANDTTGIINFDAHFDLREPVGALGNSGTGFYQIAKDLEQQQRPFAYLPVGIRRISNTQQLFQTAAGLKVPFIEAEAIYAGNMEPVQRTIQEFIDNVQRLCLTIDLDVFAASVAPGVSAPAFNGISPGHCFQQLFQQVLRSGKLVSFDIAELNPAFDIDHRTAKLAADLIFRLVSDHGC